MGNLPNGQAAGAPPRRRPLFLLGVVVFVLGVAGLVLQLQLKQLIVPWYLPVAGTVGVVLMATGAWQRRSVLRFVALVPFAVVCGFAWFLVTVGGRVPAYTG